MALQKKTISLPFALGLDEKTSSETGQPGSLEEAKNATFDKQGSIVKRTGFRTFSSPTSTDDYHVTDNGVRIDSFNGETLVCDGTQLAGITSNSSGAKYSSGRGALYNCIYSKTNILSGQSQGISNVSHIAHDAGGGIFLDVYCFLLGNDVIRSVMILVKDRKTGATIQYEPIGGAASNITSSRTFAGTNATNNRTPNVKIVKLGSKIVLVFNTFGGSTCLPYYSILTFNSPTNRFTASTPQQFLFPSSSTMFFDADFSALGITSTANQLYIAGYSTKAASTVNEAKIFSVPTAQLTGTSSAQANADYTFFSTSGIDFDISMDTLRMSPGFLCHYYEGDPSNKPIVVALTMPPTSGKTTRASIFALSTDLSSAFSTDVANDVIVVNGAQAPYTTDGTTYPSQVDKRKVVLTLANTGINSTDYVHPYSRQQSSGGVPAYYPIKSISLTGSPSGSAPSGSGYLSISPLASSSTVNSSARIYYDYVAHSDLDVSIEEGGTLFQATAAEIQNIEDQLSVAIDGTGSTFLRGHLGVSFDTPLDTPVLTPESYDYQATSFSVDISGSTLTASEDRQFPSSTVITDGILLSNENRYFQNYSGAIPPSMFFGLSKNNSGKLTQNAYDCIMSVQFGKNYSSPNNYAVAAYLPSGEASANCAMDYHSKSGPGPRLFTNTASWATVQSAGSGIYEYEFATSNLVSINTETIAGAGSFSVSKSSLNMRPLRALPAVGAGTQMLYGGGALFSYDGQTVVENGFYEYPEVRSIIQKVRQNSLLSAGSYSYIFTYEYVDAKGNIHRSPTSPAVSITAEAQSSISIRVYVDSITRKFGSVNLVAYRTEQGGSLFKKISVTQIATFDSVVTIDDIGEDSDVFAEAEAIYTTGGVLDDAQPGSITDIVLHKNRLILSTSSEFVRYSKPLAQLTAPGFPVPQFIVDIPGDIQNITGVESGVNFFVVFTKNDVFAVYGDGPNAVGQGGFSLPTSIGKGQGLPAASHHLNHAFGIFYISDRGLYLISPNGQIQYVGSQVEDSLTSAGTVINMSLFDYANEIRILASQSNIAGSMRMFVFNTFFKQWSIWDIPNNASLPVFQTQVQDLSGVSSPETSHTVLNLNGSITTQKTDYLDQPSATLSDIDLSVTLKKMHMAGLQGAQRVYRGLLLYEDKVVSGVASITMKFALDDETSFSQSETITAPSSPSQVRVHLTNQKCYAIKTQIIVQHGQSNSPGLILNGIAFEVGARPSTFKLPAANTL